MVVRMCVGAEITLIPARTSSSPRDPGSLPFLRHPTVCHLRYSDREIVPGASFDTYSQQRFFSIPASPLQPVRYLVDTNKTGAHSRDPVLERQRHVATVNHRPKTQRNRETYQISRNPDLEHLPCKSDTRLHPTQASFHSTSMHTYTIQSPSKPSRLVLALHVHHSLQESTQISFWLRSRHCLGCHLCQHARTA